MIIDGDAIRLFEKIASFIGTCILKVRVNKSTVNGNSRVRISIMQVLDVSIQMLMQVRDAIYHERVVNLSNTFDTL